MLDCLLNLGQLLFNESASFYEFYNFLMHAVSIRDIECFSQTLDYSIRFQIKPSRLLLSCCQLLLECTCLCTGLSHVLLEFNILLLNYRELLQVLILQVL